MMSIVSVIRFLRQISKRTLILLVLAFSSILFSLFLEKVAPETGIHHFWSIYTMSELFREIGFALGIAFAVIATVELESRGDFNRAINKKIDEIQKNVFAATFERQIPRNILDEIDELIFKGYFIRSKHVTHYNLDICHIPGPVRVGVPQVVKVEMISSYTIQNVGSMSRQFPIKLSVEKQPFPDMHSMVKAELTCLEHDGRAEKPDQETSDNTERSIVREWLSKPIPPGGTIHVETRATMVKFLTDYEIWRSFYPTTDFRVNVRFPHGHLKFGVDPLHRLPLRERVTGDNAREYEAQGAILPHQGVVIWWCCDTTFSDIYSHMPVGDQKVDPCL